MNFFLSLPLPLLITELSSKISYCSIHCCFYQTSKPPWTHFHYLLLDCCYSNFVSDAFICYLSLSVHSSTPVFLSLPPFLSGHVGTYCSTLNHKVRRINWTLKKIIPFKFISREATSFTPKQILTNHFPVS